MKILVSGFEPYGAMPTNPTQTLVEQARSFELGGIEVYSILLPVSYDECVDVLIAEIERVSPDAVVACGLAPGRTAITPERVGLNIKDTMIADPIPDNCGHKPLDEPINPQGPDALFATLPYRQITADLLAAGIPAYVSNSAETYICNNTMFGVLDHIASRERPVPAGFVHFPASTAMAVNAPTLPSMPIEMMARALRIILTTVARQDAK